MLFKTRAIVIRSIDYSETSIIVKVYTEEFGLQSYLIKGAKRSKASIRASLFQPLFLLNLNVYNKEGKQLQTIKEATLDIPLNSTYTNPSKISILFFINEMLNKCLQEAEANPELFSFLHEAIQFLDSAEAHFTNFHLIFLVRLSRYLGFYPQGNYTASTPMFDLREGRFVRQLPTHPDYLLDNKSKLIYQIITSNWYSMEKLEVSYQERKEILENLIRLYQIHLSFMGNISSHKVLEEIFK